ncbi:hypothetical protein [uncultured Nostoc sp.]|uniref:hypothetical protein n=1 Tax=uncultured Nostoc sp. TaxID=340711 RepID=UPI0035CAD8D9
MSLHRESRQVGICRECNRRVQPTPVMSVSQRCGRVSLRRRLRTQRVMISKNQTELGSLVGVNRTVAQLYK